MSDGPDQIEMIRQLREAVGLFSGAMPITPQAAWETALDRVRGLAEGRCWKCMETESWETVIEQKGTPDERR